jgi:hypothetical protein
MIEEPIGLRMIVIQDDLPCLRPETSAQMDIHPVLPIGMPDCMHPCRVKETTGNEVVMGDRICGEVGKVAESNRVKGLRIGTGENLFAYLPVVRVPPHGRILFSEGDIRGDGAIQEGESVTFEDRADCGREQVERREDCLTDRNMGPRPPGNALAWSDEEPEEGNKKGRGKTRDRHPEWGELIFPSSP